MAPLEDAGETTEVVDGLPLIKAAKDLKDTGNASVKAKCYGEAVGSYERAIAVLDKADGHPMLRQEVEEMIALKSVLYGNVAQCMLHQELWRRAIDAATRAVELDGQNSKAFHRRSQAHEALRRWAPALEDALALQRLGGGGLSDEALAARVAVLRSKKEEQERELAAESSEDEADNALLRMKARFDEVVDKYDLTDGEAAGELADWLTSGEWLVTTQRVAQRWKMEEEDAEAFLKWISKGLEFKMANAENAAQMSAASPQVEA